MQTTINKLKSTIFNSSLSKEEVTTVLGAALVAFCNKFPSCELIKYEQLIREAYKNVFFTDGADYALEDILEEIGIAKAERAAYKETMLEDAFDWDEYLTAPDIIYKNDTPSIEDDELPF